jgi:hypothetical protein
MANSLVDLENDIMKASDVVAREVVGFVPASSINVNGSEEAALNDTVRSSFTRSVSTSSVTPSMTIPEGTDQTVDNKTLTLDKFKAVQIPYTGEDVRHLDNGIGFNTVYGDQILQAMRAITNEVEADLFTEAYTNASRAVGTAGTTPFGSNHNVVNEARQILVDNGAPQDGMLSLVMNTSAGTNFRNLTNLYKVNEAGDSSLLRQGVLTDISGIMMRESAQIASHTKGTGTGYLINNGSGEAIGETALAVETGSGTILAGDILTHASDSDNKYVVNTALAGGSVVIGEPGLRIAAADNDALTVGNNYTPNVLMHRNAMELAMRAPSEPVIGGINASAAMFSTSIQDPRSGLSFSVKIYGGYHKGMVEVSAVWGVKAWLPKYIATVLG